MLPFQRGRLFSGDDDDVVVFGYRELRREAGVGVFIGLGEGAVTEGGLGIPDFLLAAVGVGCGRPEKRRTLDMVDRAALPTELPRRLDEPSGVLEWADRITDEAGELPGVSDTLFVAGLSMVTMLEMESRSCCWVFAKSTSSSDSSMTLMLALSAFTRDFISASSRSVSPLTVNRSLTPFCTIETTRSIAGT